MAAHEQKLTVKELPYTIGMVLLDIAAPIALMIGISKTTAANASLLNNFEIVATSLIALLLGFVAYGLSIVCYIYAQRELGAARTSAYYAIAPFIGVALSLAIFMELPSASFLVALLVMIAGTCVVTLADQS